MRKKGFETVLVVDDDPLLLHIIEAEIALYGYKPILAKNAQEAFLANHGKWLRIGCRMRQKHATYGNMSLMISSS